MFNNDAWLDQIGKRAPEEPDWVRSEHKRAVETVKQLEAQREAEERKPFPVWRNSKRTTRNR